MGAHPLAIHGCPRATGDFDSWVRCSSENAPKVWRASASFGAPLTNVTDGASKLQAGWCELAPRRAEATRWPPSPGSSLTTSGGGARRWMWRGFQSTSSGESTS